MDIKRSLQIVTKDKKYISPSSKISYYPLVVKRGHGSTIEDVDGNIYIDLLSSAASANVGHSHPKVIEAICNQSKELTNYSSCYLYNEPATFLAEKLSKITPGNFKKRVSFGLSGSDANDAMIKYARAYTGRNKVLSYVGSYHGTTYGALSLSAISLNMRRKVGPFLPEIYHLNYPDCYRCKFGKSKDDCSLNCFDELISASKTYLPLEEIAAIFFEPIQGDNGILIPPKKYVLKLKEFCEENGILFVSEEVQQGFGRTGKWFGIENFDVEPDAVILGKSIASGMPLSAIVARSEIIESIDSPGQVFTNSANMICCAAGLATINIIEEENLVEKSKITGGIALDRFKNMMDKYEIIGDVRGLGLSIGIDLVKDRKSKEKNNDAAAKICYRCYEKGLILTFFSRNVLRIQPPLVITDEELESSIDIIEDSIKEYLNGSIPDEVLSNTKGW